jgi:hypothetical protein
MAPLISAGVFLAICGLLGLTFRKWRPPITLPPQALSLDHVYNAHNVISLTNATNAAVDARFPDTTGTSQHALYREGIEKGMVLVDEHQDLDKYTLRLLKEWKQHGKVIIALDVDDTILPYRTATQAECDEIISLVKECQAVGAWVILYTCRNADGMQEALDYCKSKDLHIDNVNKNPGGIVLPYGNTAKPYANIYLDDRGHLQASSKRLRECMYRMRAEQWSQRLDSPGSTEF